MDHLSLFEFEDLTWLPLVWRDQITELLHHRIAFPGVYLAIVPFIVETLRETSAERIVDMGSGSGGNIIGLHAAIDEACNETIPIVLSDKFPNLEGLSPYRRSYQWPCRPVDATQVPRNVGGLRTMFTAFRHLSPKLAHKILVAAVNAEAPILIAEPTNRSFFNVLRAIFIGPLMAWIESARIPAPLAGNGCSGLIWCR